MAGEIYTTFTFLGGSGWAYGKGAPTYYILCYGRLAFILSYWLLPPIWRYAQTHHLISQPHYFTHAYNSPLLGGLVALVGIVALIPYMVLQLKGLGIIVSTSSYGSISPSIAIWIGAAIVTAYVMVSGVHGSAWNAVIKDATILLIVVFLGVYLPLRLYGGYGAMFRAIDEAKPGFLALPQHGQSVLWFSSSVLLSALGFYMWPHAFGALCDRRRPNHRGAAADGLRLCYATLSGIDRQPHAAQSRQHRRRVCRHRRRRRHGVADDLTAADPDESSAVSAVGS